MARRTRTTVNMNQIVGTHDIVLMTLDTLRYDVAQSLFNNDRLPVLSKYLAKDGWEARHTPGSFTYAAHHAIFAGFLPTPIGPGPHSRLFAVAFPGSESTATDTFVFDSPDIVSGLAAEDYRTICIGGVGFFNLATPLGKTLPALFQEQYWDESTGVTCPESTENQINIATRCLSESDEKTLLFMNISAIHQPNRFYLPNALTDTVESHGAALEYVDGQLATLFAALQKRPRPTFVMMMSDHGTTYGEDGYHGHRLAHEHVWTVPYTHFILENS